MLGQTESQPLCEATGCWDEGDDVFFTLITTWLGPPSSAQLRARIQLWPLSEPNTRVLMSLPIDASQNQRQFEKSLFIMIYAMSNFSFINLPKVSCSVSRSDLNIAKERY